MEETAAERSRASRNKNEIRILRLTIITFVVVWELDLSKSAVVLKSTPYRHNSVVSHTGSLLK